MKFYIENISKKLMKYNLIQLIMILNTINMRPMHLQSWKHNPSCEPALHPTSPWLPLSWGWNTSFSSAKTCPGVASSRPP